MNRFICLKHVQLDAYNSKKKIDSIVRTLTPFFVKKKGGEKIWFFPPKEGSLKIQKKGWNNGTGAGLFKWGNATFLI